jgi:hypothetical protein
MTKQEQPKEYIVDILKVDTWLEKYVEDFATFSKREKMETVKEIHDIIVTCSHPHTPAAPDEDTVTMPRWVFEWLMEPPKTVEDRKGHLNTEIAEIIKSLRHQSTEARK